MINGDQFSENAKTFIGTPFHHQGRTPGVGTDCVGLVWLTAHISGIHIADRKDYARIPEGRSLETHLEASCDRVPVCQIQNGDIIVFWYNRKDVPQHVGIKTTYGFIHSHAGSLSKVVETTLDDRWLKRIFSVWRIKEMGKGHRDPDICARINSLHKQKPPCNCHG